MSRAILFLALTAGCGQKGDCIDHGDCLEGEGCVEGTCQVVDCVSSVSCGLRSFCDLKSYTCKDGCESDADCVAGETCDVESHQCSAYGCRDTDLDCYYNEWCDQDLGVCVQDEDPHCKPCQSSATCNGGTCFSFDTAADTYCLMPCTPGDACPRGYNCQDATGANEFYCVAWCSTYDDLGYLPW